MTALQRSFSKEDIAQIVAALGSDPPVLSGGQMVFQTICHNPPHTGSHKLYYYPDGWFHCYTQCGDSFDIYTLVQRAKHCSFSEALGFISSVLGLGNTQRKGFTPSRMTDWDILDRLSGLYPSHAQDEAAVYQPIPKSILDFYPPCAPVEWQREGITPETCAAFDIRCDPAAHDIIIPHFDLHGNLIGIRSRSFDPEKVAAGFKYMPTQFRKDRDFRHSLRHNLYGLSHTAPAIRRIGKAILFEAEKSVLQCQSYYGKDNFAVAACGSNISTIQRDLILDAGAHEVFLAFDKEFHSYPSQESDRYSDKILKLASLFTPYVSTYVLWDKTGLLSYQDSPSDKGRQILEKLMKTKNEVTMIA